MPLSDYECSLCDELVVKEVTLDLAYIEMVPQMFARAINEKDFIHAQAIVSNLLFSGQMLGRYTTHQAHIQEGK